MPNGDRDGIANVLLEAMALGTAVVTTDAGAAREVVEDDVTGILLPADVGTEKIADAVIALAGDAGLRNRLARAARLRVEAQFDARHTARSLSAWLENSLTADGVKA